MSTITVAVRHAGKKYDVDLDLDEPGLTFKMQLYSLTGVPPERQKILVKGGQLKDDADMKTLSIKPNHSFMLLGTAGELPKAPPAKTQFIEDMSDREVAAVSEVPNGLENMGNTCYLNSSLQALRTVPELKDALASYQGSAPALQQSGDRNGAVSAALRDLYKNLGSTTQSVYPHMFLSIFRQAFPQFAERDPQNGMYKQQDAEEAWSQILTSLKQSLKDGSADSGQSLIDRYFGGKYQVSIACTEEKDHTPVETRVEDFWKLDCHISVQTNFLKDGLLEGLKDTLEKHNDYLGRDAKYEVTKKVTRLPKYLTVHFMRFFWRSDTRKKSKILRKVGFPFVYDATELCSDDLKAKLIPARDKFREVEKDKEEIVRAAKRAKLNALDNVATSSAGSSKGAEQAISAEKEKEFKDAVAKALDPELSSDPSCNPTGLYELSAIITHKGATADAGHYQCFVKNTKQPNEWFKFNDDKVSILDDARIEMLAGGGESDSALILLYRSLEL